MAAILCDSSYLYLRDIRNHLHTFSVVLARGLGGSKSTSWNNTEPGEPWWTNLTTHLKLAVGMFSLPLQKVNFLQQLLFMEL
jgi:hypothetical protein